MSLAESRETGNYPGRIVKSFEEPSGLEYLSSTYDVVAEEFDDKTRYEIRFDHPPIRPEQFTPFLNHIAPADGYDADTAILGDWVVVDRTPPGENSESHEASRLVRLHEHLGEAWTDFMPSRPAFMTVMQDGKVPHFYSRGNYFIRMLLDKSDIGSHHIFEQVGQDGDNGIRDLESIYRDTGISHPGAFVAKGLFKAINRTRNPRRQLRNEPKIWKHYRKLPPRTRSALLQDAIKGWDEVRVADFIEAGIGRLYTSADHDGRTYFLPRLQIKGELQDYFDKPATLRRENSYGRLFEAQEISLPVRYKDGPYRDTPVTLPDSVRPLSPPHMLIPRIIWEKDADGARRFVIGPPEYSNDGLSIYDSVAGVLLTSYMAPDIRAKWPKAMSIKGSPKQPIGAAQVPVLALFPGVRQQLLGSTFLTESEKLAV